MALSVIMPTLASAASHPDIEREKRMASEIVDSILDGEPVTLEAGGHEFLGIFTEAEEPRGSVLVLHGRGFHPDWQTVVQPMRVGLVEHGWNTLAIQLPVLEKQAKYFDYVPIFPYAIPRIEAALDFLAKNSRRPIVIVAHSCGSHMAQHWINAKGDEALRRFDGYVGIGMGATDYRQPMVEPFALDKMRMPVLDLYGEEDYPAVLRMAPERAEMLKEGGDPRSRQLEAPGADHYFVDKGDLLVELVAGWLDEVWPRLNEARSGWSQVISAEVRSQVHYRPIAAMAAIQRWRQRVLAPSRNCAGFTHILPSATATR